MRSHSPYNIYNYQPNQRYSSVNCNRSMGRNQMHYPYQCSRNCQCPKFSRNRNNNPIDISDRTESFHSENDQSHISFKTNTQYNLFETLALFLEKKASKSNELNTYQKENLFKYYLTNINPKQY